MGFFPDENYLKFRRISRLGGFAKMAANNVDVSIIIPCYNEQKAIISTLSQIIKATSALKESFEIICVDDHSSDRTGELIAKFGKARLIRNQKNLGYGASIKKAMLQAKGEYLLITDADGTYPIKDIPALVSQRLKYDMVVGARVKKKSGIPLLRRPAKLFLSILANYICNARIPDLNSGFRIFRRDLAMKFYGLYPEGFSLTTTITVAALSNGYSVKYIPIEYYKRKGKSSIKPIRDFVGFTTLILRLSIYFKPMQVFLPVSIFFMLAGSVKLAIDFAQHDYFGIGGVFLAATGIQLLFMGLLADLIIRRTELVSPK